MTDEKRSEAPAQEANGKKVRGKPDRNQGNMEAKQPRQFTGQPKSTEVRK